MRKRSSMRLSTKPGPETFQSRESSLDTTPMTLVTTWNLTKTADMLPFSTPTRTQASPHMLVVLELLADTVSTEESVEDTDTADMDTDSDSEDMDTDSASEDMDMDLDTDTDTELS